MVLLSAPARACPPAGGSPHDLLGSPCCCCWGWGARPSSAESSGCCCRCAVRPARCWQPGGSPSLLHPACTCTTRSACLCCPLHPSASSAATSAATTMPQPAAAQPLARRLALGPGRPPGRPPRRSRPSEHWELRVSWLEMLPSDCRGTLLCDWRRQATCRRERSERAGRGELSWRQARAAPAACCGPPATSAPSLACWRRTPLHAAFRLDRPARRPHQCLVHPQAELPVDGGVVDEVRQRQLGAARVHGLRVQEGRQAADQPAGRRAGEDSTLWRSLCPAPWEYKCARAGGPAVQQASQPQIPVPAAAGAGAGAQAPTTTSPKSASLATSWPPGPPLPPPRARVSSMFSSFRSRWITCGSARWWVQRVAGQSSGRPASAAAQRCG
jgi:hypothetical protein